MPWQDPATRLPTTDRVRLIFVVAEAKSYETSDSEPTLSENTSFNINHIFMFYFINTPVHIEITASDEWTTSLIYSTQISFASTCVSRNSNVLILLHCSVREIHRTPLDTISCYSGNSFDIYSLYDNTCSNRRDYSLFARTFACTHTSLFC